MSETSIYVVKTTANQERSVANLIAQIARKDKYDIRALLVPDVLKGYVLVEAPAPEIMDQAIQGVPHARSVIKGASSIQEVEHFLTPRPAVTGITEGAIVELISGPFKGEMARVKRVDMAKEEITVELFEAMVPIPITVRGDNVRVLSKDEAQR
jgi:transcription termination/antitermination protein NusG